MHEFRKILVIRFSSLGDVILTSPLLKTLKQRYPDSKIDYVVKSSYRDVLHYNPNLNQLIEVDDDLDFGKLNDLRKTLQAGGYDLILDAHNNIRTFYLKLFLMWGSKIISLKKYSFRKFLLVKFKINLMRNLPPIAQRYMRNLQLTMDNGQFVPEIFTDGVSSEHIANLPKDKKMICIVPGTKHFTKTYPAEYYGELIRLFDKDKFAFVLAGKGDDRENIDVIKKITGSNVIDYCDKLSLLELAGLIKKCSLVIAGDTGPMHIAEALRVPLIMITGSSVKEFGFFPVSKNSIVIENAGLKCRPCSHIGRDSCPLGHFKCMREIRPETVYEKIMEMVS